ncbi:primosomal protein N' [Aerococcus christensenii]|nr:primosomal protein N' [Aerococcus christensenii]MDK8233524.1 primosomal protein N' [Aerococcus christensenii]
MAFVKSKLIARVIVDVPSMQTDQLYDYKIPDQYQGLVSRGMRVSVPFGQRQVLAYVVEICENSAFSGELRTISGLLDDRPVLTEELLELGCKMARSLFNFVVECYQTMLPRLLKVDYDKVFCPTPTISQKNRKNYFSKEDQVTWKACDEFGQLNTYLQLVKAGEVRIKYLVKDRKSYKMEKWVQPLLSPEQLQIQLEGISSRAKKQRELCEELMQLSPHKIPVKVLKDEKNISLEIIKKGQEKGWLRLLEERVSRDPYAHKNIPLQEAKTLFSEQKRAFEAVRKAMDAEEEKVFLLQGVTGSGKTEVYLQLIQHALDQGKTALLLVPEISLTPQMVEQLKGRFGKLVAVLHSQLSVGEHFDEWSKLRNGQAKIAVGARSSIFAPLDHIGVIIIDEEHESTYKQNDTPRYHARMIAKWRGHYHHCPVLLGSATPSLESRARAQNGVYQLLKMSHRTNHMALPQVTLVDMRQEFKKKNYYQFSYELKQAMEETFRRGEQVALMLNRRGYANYLMCRDCGYVFQCKDCDVSLTFHYQAKQLQCHYCGYSLPYPQCCLKCGGKHLRDFGSGTERVEQEIYQLFPEQTVVRMDNDTTRKKGAHERLLSKVASGQADILLGTQMIAKGLDFPNITLVGVINADTSLYLPDFRASERTFQLLTQVSGRTGRGDKEGRVIIQTFNPEHYALQFAASQDYEGFYQREMHFRKLNHYSPYFYTIRITISSFEEKQALKKAYQVLDALKEKDYSQDNCLIGPSQSAIARKKNRYYFQILYHYRQLETIRESLETLKKLAQEWSQKKIYVMIDVEPMTFL